MPCKQLCYTVCVARLWNGSRSAFTTSAILQPAVQVYAFLLAHSSPQASNSCIDANQGRLCIWSMEARTNAA